MKIPQIRERLHELAKELDCPELAELAEATRRKPYARKGLRQSRRITHELAEEIRLFATYNQTMPLSAIAHRFNVNPGRVSEILNGMY